MYSFKFLDMSCLYSFAVNFIQQTRERLVRSGGIAIPSDLNQVTNTCHRLQEMLTKLTEYVDAVIVSILLILL